MNIIVIISIIIMIIIIIIIIIVNHIFRAAHMFPDISLR